MTTAHVEKFSELVGKDPALLAKLGLDKVNADAAAAAASAAAFITNSVKEAKALGLEFTEEEFHAFMDAEAKAAASGELSDTQLEEVAGGLVAVALVQRLSTVKSLVFWSRLYPNPEWKSISPLPSP